MNDKMREEFEAAYLAKYDLKPQNWNGVAYLHAHGNGAWWAWQASRAALVVELPKLSKVEGCAELAEAKETISRYEVTAENCDVLRAELANQLEVKAFWIGRTRALEVELAAINAQDSVAWEVYYADDDSFHTITRDKALIEGYSKMAYTIKPLYAAPVSEAKESSQSIYNI